MDNKFTENGSKTAEKTSVLIAGGGITGLTAALFLIRHGMNPILIERHRSTSIHPRARGFDVRTMELYRELQVSGSIREAGRALSPSWGIHTGPSVAGTLRKVKPRAGTAAHAPAQSKELESLFAQSPETTARCTQDLSEPVLLAALREREADTRFFHELISFEQDEDGVSALIKDRETGQERVIFADYMIAADGAKSGIRETLKAPTTGKGVLGNLLNIYFEADLAAFVHGREFSLIRIHQAGIRGLFAAINNRDRWVFHLHYDAKNERPENFTGERILEVLGKVIGIPGTHIRVISVLPWQPTVKVADELQHGRIFLAGDAAHVMTPFGGKGANSGVQDVHNLSWKLAAVISGKAGPSLLQTYGMERQPIGWYYARLSGEMADRNGLLKKIPVNMIRAFVIVKTAHFFGLQKLFPRVAMHQLGNLFGLPDYKYTSPAIFDGMQRQSAFAKAGALDGKPGTRVPHIWVAHRNKNISTLDLLGIHFVLLTGIDNAAWKNAAAHARQNLDMEIPVYSIGETGDLLFAGKSLTSVFGITDAGALLVRPDGFVAWRSVNASGRHGVLEGVLRKILSPKQ